jgi:hypothetical protein
VTIVAKSAIGKSAILIAETIPLLHRNAKDSRIEARPTRRVAAVQDGREIGVLLARTVIGHRDDGSVAEFWIEGQVNGRDRAPVVATALVKDARR